MRLENKELQFSKIFDEFYLKIKTFSVKLLKSEEEAEDIAQNVFLSLWDMPQLWINSDAWKKYIFPMTRNMIYDCMRHKLVEEKYQASYDVSPENIAIDNISCGIYAKEIKLLVNLTLNQMPERRRQIYTMSREEKLSNKEIADKLGLSIRTVEHHLYLALSDLKKKINPFLMVVMCLVLKR